MAKSARNGPQGVKIRLSAVDPLSKSGIDFFGVILAAKHYMIIEVATSMGLKCFYEMSER